MKYIDAVKLIAEIDNRMEDCKLPNGKFPTTTNIVRYEELSCLRNFITSLQQEQPEADYSEFEKALNEFGEAYATLVDRDNNPNQGIGINSYHELVQENISRILELAKEHVKQEQPDGLNEAFQIYSDNHPYESRHNLFKAGAEWMAGQGVTFETEVYESYTGKPIIEEITESFIPGDKVIVQIRKK